MASGSLSRRVRGAVGLLLIVGSMISIAMFGMFPLLVLLPLPFAYPAYRWLLSFIVGCWHAFSGLVLEKVFGIHSVVTGDAIDPTVGSILMSNHRTRLDWAMLWPVLARFGANHVLRIVLKADIRKIPILGWGCSIVRYIFLQRKWEEDASHFHSMIRCIGDGGSYTLLIFPEGTDMNERGITSSNAFADKAGRPRYTQILHPRTKGMVEAVNALRSARTPLSVVYDVTIGYRGTIAQNEKMLAAGATPHTMETHIIAVPVASLPRVDENLAAWIERSFRIKEAALIAYYGDSEGKLSLLEAYTRAARDVALAEGALLPSPPAPAPVAAAAAAGALVNNPPSPAPAAVSASAGPAAGPAAGASSGAGAGAVPSAHGGASGRGAAANRPWFEPLLPYTFSTLLSAAFVALSWRVFLTAPLWWFAYLAAISAAFIGVGKTVGGMDKLELRLHGYAQCSPKAAAAPAGADKPKAE